MSDKSYVTLSARQCPVCGKVEEDGSVLLDTRLRNTFERQTVVGWGLCAEHRALTEQGYCHLIECSAESPEGKVTVQPHELPRTGRIMHAKREFLCHVLQGMEPQPLMMVPPEVFEQLAGMYREAVGEEPRTLTPPVVN